MKLRSTLVFPLILLLTGCAAGLRVDQIAAIDSSQKDLVLMTGTRWDTKIRRELAKQGFRVKRFTSVKEIEVSNSNVKETFNLADARYGLTVIPGRPVDWCVGGRAIKFSDFSLEVTDLKTNDLVMIVEQGGWTDTCLGLYGDLFPDLAKALRANWK
ncbi:hypothetical protein [Salinisphaera sp. G21_0]|uniref:hypothetical protein n=1 Tax=Salinisphaera sp. G21_0 TaxID=2821094 RepID=UPI001ADCE2B1|nr:hypothetical protein [Salinisphaera sp. G21_0]MBO9484714.1 hypothetical protein [Salinisphaera sp. G21_0]